MTDQTDSKQNQQNININVNSSGSRYTTMASEKKRKTALILCLLTGMFGGHMFYTGRIGKGFLYLFTGGLFFIGVIMDTISIVSGSFKDNVDAPLREW